MHDYWNKLENVDELIRNYLIPFSSKVIGAFAIWIIGSFLIRLAQRVLRTTLNRRRLDPTLINYAHATLNLILKAFLLLAVLGVFGIETTSFSALLAATGVAIGMAWSGLLSNFAAGVFLIVLRPFRVGETITAGGVTGVVREIGMFATTIDNSDNLRFFVGNNKIFSDNILNYSANPSRTLSFRIQLPPATLPDEAIEKFTQALSVLPQLKSSFSGEISEFTPLGVAITLKSSCHQNDYAALVASGNRIVFEVMKTQNYLAEEAKAVFLAR